MGLVDFDLKNKHLGNWKGIQYSRVGLNMLTVSCLPMVI